MPKIPVQCPEQMRGYKFHGVEFNLPSSGEQAVAVCPFCGRDKMYININTGLWDCKVCNLKGNLIEWLRKLWDASTKATNGAIKDLAADRKMLYPETLEHWGICQSVINKGWLIPGFNSAKQLTQLYRYSYNSGEKRMMLYPTPTLTPGHGLLGANLYDSGQDVVYLCEGLWDGCALFEIVKGKASVLAVPAAPVWQDSWLTLFKDKTVVMLYDSDYPNIKDGVDRGRAGWKGMERVGPRISTATKEVHYVWWGDNGYDPARPTGFDIRDWLTEGTTFEQRTAKLVEIINRVQPIPEVWRTDTLSKLNSIACQDWATLIAKWEKAMVITPGLDLAISVMLATTIAVMLPEDQLWTKIIGPPSSAKSVICEAFAANENYVVCKSTIRGLHSGYKTDKHGDEDHGLLKEIIGKHFVLKDGDTFLTLPNIKQVMAEFRDAYDGASRIHYRHGVSRDFDGYRFGHTIAGTESLRALDSSELGERYIDCEIGDMDNATEKEVGLRAIRDMVRACTMDGEANMGISIREKTEAQKMTAGYIDHLRNNDKRLLGAVKVSHEVESRIQVLALFVAYMRSRPSKTQEEKAQRELHFRLAKQLTKLSICLTAVLNKTVVDDDVMRRVTLCAMSTARGTSLAICYYLYTKGLEGETQAVLTYQVQQTDDSIKPMIRFLKRIGAIEIYTANMSRIKNTQYRWTLTPTMRKMFEEIYYAVNPTDAKAEEPEHYQPERHPSSNPFE